RRKFKSYNIDKFTDEIIERAIISVLTNQKSPSLEDALRTILMESLDDDNKFMDKIKSHFSMEGFWFHIEKNYGYKQENKSLKKLLIYMMITALSHTIEEEKLNIYKDFIGQSGRGNCLIFLDRWMNHKKDYSHYDDYAREIEKEINFSQVISGLEIDKIKNSDIFPLIDKAIILHITNALEQGLQDFEEYAKLIRLRKSKHFYEGFQYIYEALLNVVRMYEFRKKYALGIPADKAEKMVQAYTEDYYLMDLYYRKFYVAYDAYEPSEILKKLKYMAEGLYTNWYMGELSTSWTKALMADNKDEWDITGIRKQRHFYFMHVDDKLKKGEKVYVIISDALRYDVAAELCDKLDSESLGSAELRPMVTGLPTNTKFGMARLLPHEKLQLKDNGQIYIEGMSSGTMEGRQGILSLHEKSSVAIDYKDFMKMGKNELREYCKPKKLIYIYHDSIDALGDKAASEIYAFDGAEKAFDEIFKLIKNIRGNLSGTNIFITADHGFIYQRDELEEVDKIGKEKIDFVESKRRYVITKENRDIDGLLRYSMKDTLGDDCNLNVYIPKANIRFKTQGAGANFVHGGASLQEVVIPLITYKNRWSGQSDAKSPEKTKIKLTNAIRKITNSIFTLNFFQTERVEGKITPCSVRVYMVDENDNLISNEEVLLGDKTSQNPEDRNISIRFVLKSMDYDKNRNYYLIIKDDDTDVVYDRIPFSISLGITSDFDF
ncbi:MAG: BREX-1 system phosphatase PglZ type A, partial [Lutispora sp.]